MSSQRYIELDLLRTAAIAGMIIYHLAFDLSQFYNWDIDVFSGGWKIFQVTVASLFLLLVGITSSFSNRHILKRFLRIGAAALLVTIATYIIDPNTYVRFGVLHLIAVSAVCIPLLACLRAWLIIPGIALLIVGPAVSSLSINSPLLLPLGITYAGFSTVDYFPLIPWFGVVLIGYGIGPFSVRWMRLRENSSQLSVLAAPGKHSLMLYLIHQPIIIGILWILLGKPEF